MPNRSWHPLVLQLNHRQPATIPFFLKPRDTELMQYRRPVGAGPSSKTWPRCPLQTAHCTSTRRIPKLLSTTSMIFDLSSTGIKAGPAATGVKLRFGRKKFCPATLANVNAGFPKLIILTDIGPLGVLLPEHGIFFRCQFLFPLFFCLGEAHNFEGYGWCAG